MPGFIGTPPNCRPECVSNSECSNNLACINNKCADPCPGICNVNAECKTISHIAMCTCIRGFTGDPFVQCIPESKILYHILCSPYILCKHNLKFLEPLPPQSDVISACQRYPCGANAICRESSGSSICTCLTDFYGNPYEGCRPECLINSDCQLDRTCIRNKCQDSCPGSCGQNTMCQVINHVPTCTCIPGYTGNPFQYCNMMQMPSKSLVENKNMSPKYRNETNFYVLVIPGPTDSCNPSPCGPNSQCRNNNGQAICTCLPTFLGTPPACKPECTVSSECPVTRSCVNQKCVDPCQGICGIGAECRTVFHSPLCSCKPGQTGDPFVRCFEMLRKFFFSLQNF